jgi:four helix bundle protein
MFQSFEELDVWKRACQVSVSIYELLNECRVFALRDQMQRAGVSIASNIAEGCERGGRDFIRFLTIARSSAAELRTQCYIACRIGVLTTEQMIPLVAELKEISMMMTGLAQAIQKRLGEGPTPQLNTEN